ncbi:hypothetical protein [Stenotrophomonas sepilia]|uniref:hypothetical protein n=1 Tax=Stenotrophomonas sepilia TaxID=2860290 RepID=UPI002E76AFDB|nr:hypothetical protein [Stenotrophomonas sepilia]
MLVHPFNDAGFAAFSTWLSEAQAKLSQDLFELQKAANAKGKESWLFHCEFWEASCPDLDWIERELEVVKHDRSEADFERYQVLESARVAVEQTLVDREWRVLNAMPYGEPL